MDRVLHLLQGGAANLAACLAAHVLPRPLPALLHRGLERTASRCVSYPAAAVIGWGKTAA